MLVFAYMALAVFAQVLDACLKEISRGLLEADVNVKLVMNLQTNVKKRANSADKGAGLNKRKIIEKAVLDELCSMLSTSANTEEEKKLVDLKKGHPNVVMFVGLQVHLSACLLTPDKPLVHHACMQLLLKGDACHSDSLQASNACRVRLDIWVM